MADRKVRHFRCLFLFQPPLFGQVHIPGIGDIVNVSIRPESVSFNIYEPEIMTVRVKNAAAVASQRALFEVLWGVAK